MIRSIIASLVLILLLGNSTTVEAGCDLVPKFAYSTKGKTLSLTNKSLGEYSALEWNFGDGKTSKDLHPKHIYKQPGMYAFTLTVSSEDGCSETFEAKVYIFDLKSKAVAAQQNEEKSIEDIENQQMTEDSEDAIAADSAQKDAVADEQSVPFSNLTALNNAPNPFGNSTLLSFNLIEAAHVQIHIYNTNGQLVQVIAEERMPSGLQQIRFERQGLPSGNYLLTASTPEQRMTHNMSIQ